MIFWTIVFIIYYLALITRGNLYYDNMKKNGELMLKQATIEDKKEKEQITKEILKSSWTMFLTLPLVVAIYIYLFKSITIDPYKYPSIVMLFYVLINSFVFKGKKKQDQDLTTEEGRFRYRIELEKIKRYSFKSFIHQLIYLGYFSYMFYILILN